MRQNSTRRFAGFTAAVFAIVAASSPAFPAEGNREIQDKYNASVKCSAYMAYFGVIAQKVMKSQKLEAAFDAATLQNVREALNFGKELGKSRNSILEELKGAVDVEIDAKEKKLGDAKEIAAVTTDCAPQILPLLK